MIKHFYVISMKRVNLTLNSWPQDIRNAFKILCFLIFNFGDGDESYRKYLTAATLPLVVYT